MAGWRSLTLRAVSKVLKRFDYEIKHCDAPARGFENFLRFAVRCGIAPRTVFDIGVGRGTPWLYDAFPSAKLVLFEPVEQFRPFVERIVAERRADAMMVALGAKAGRVTLRVPEAIPTSASLLSRDEAFARLERESARMTVDRFHEVDMITLDSIADRWSPPYALKVDVEGTELDVLRGARKVLESSQLVIMEMSVMSRFDGEASFADRIRFMDEAGFRLFDIPALSQTRAGGPLSFIDAAFVRRDSDLYLSRLW